MRSCPECGLRYASSDLYCSADGSKILDSDDAFLGETVGKYRIVGLLGAGGMGRVYLARNPHIGSRVAVKVLSASAAADKSLVERFFREAQLVNTIRHESIVNVLDLDELADGRPYIIMECLDGEALSAAIARGPMALARAGAIAIDILAALQAAHDAGVVHRDLKPDNVFLTKQGRVKLLDFGIAKLMPSFDATAVASTERGVLMGTPGYMAPEQVIGEGVGPATDIYAMGSILYESLTGRLAFHGQSLYELFSRIVHEAPRPPGEIRPELAGPCQELIMRAMAKRPSDRYASASEMACAIRSLLAESEARVAEPLPAGIQRGRASDLALAETAYASGAPHALGDARATGKASEHSRARRIYLGLALGLLAAGALAAVVVIEGGAPAMSSSSQLADAARTEVTMAAAAVRARDAGPDRAASRLAGADKLDAAPVGRRGAPQLPRERSSSAMEGRAPRVDEVARDAGAGGSGVTLIETGTRHAEQRLYIPADFDPSAFDAAAYVPKARALAKKIYPDAYLVGFDIDGVAPSGRANLARFDLEATYRFLSPSKAARRAPLGIAEERPCWIYVEVEGKGTTARIVDSESCKGKARPNPSCSLEQVWLRAKELGAPSAGALAKIDYLWDGWFFVIDPLGLAESIPDDC